MIAKMLSFHALMDPPSDPGATADRVVFRVWTRTPAARVVTVGGAP
jgi:hypothetical protein